MEQTRLFFRAVVVAVTVFVCLGECEGRSGGAMSDAGTQTTVAVAAPPPVPPEPTPPNAAKASEVPGLEAKLAADKNYVAIWSPDHATDRALLLTALSDIVAYGTM